MADLPMLLPVAGLNERLASIIDAEGKIPRAFDALFPLADRDVALLDAAGGMRARQLVALGARLTILEEPPRLADLERALADVEPAPIVSSGRPAATGLAASSQDAVVACWSAFHGPDKEEVAEADRILRPGGRLLVLHDYGRDDVALLRPHLQAQQIAWSRRDGPFLAAGFRVRVIHCWWTFDSLEEAVSFLESSFPETGPAVAERLKRPRLSYNVAIYHRDRPTTTA